jgi:N-formylglutamate deformylase
MSVESFTLRRGTTPLIISFPHVGTVLPEALSRRMTAEALALPDTDWHVDRLYDFAGALGAGMQVPTLSRYVVDLNRDPTGEVLYPGSDNSELVPLSTFAGQPIYRPGEAPGASEIAERVARHWQPYHRSLGDELDRLKQRFGFAVLWDAHSIASRVPRFFSGRLPDLNLGSARGKSAAPDLVRHVMAVLERASPFSSVLDGRFTGGYITRHFGRPDQGIHALQLEMAEIAYMEEAPPYAYEPARAAPLKRVLERAVGALLSWTAERGRHRSGERGDARSGKSE